MVKKILPWIIFTLFFALLIIGFSLKDNMNNYLSEMIKNQASPEITHSGLSLVDSLYNYSENNLKFEITFLEFGAISCSACKRMKSVMEEISSKHSKINVVFLNVLIPKNQNLMKLFGVASIPTQILLDRNGNEFYRHNGYISSLDLEKKIIQKR